nr:MAG TPA: hypothetical protein [Caudoviricetes sp.]
MCILFELMYFNKQYINRLYRYFSPDITKN